MARRIYIVVLLFSLILYVLLILAKQKFPPNFLVTFSLIPFLLFVAGVDGIIARSVRPEVKGGLILYSLLLGMLFVTFLFIHVFLIIPIFYPGFLRDW